MLLFINLYLFSLELTKMVVHFVFLIKKKRWKETEKLVRFRKFYSKRWMIGNSLSGAASRNSRLNVYSNRSFFWQFHFHSVNWPINVAFVLFSRVSKLTIALYFYFYSILYQQVRFIPNKFTDWFCRFSIQKRDRFKFNPWI